MFCCNLQFAFAFSFPRMVWVNSFQNCCFAAICRLFKLSRRNHATKVSTSSKRLFTTSSRLWRNLKLYLTITNQIIPKNISNVSQKFLPAVENELVWAGLILVTQTGSNMRNYLEKTLWFSSTLKQSRTKANFYFCEWSL